MYPRISDFFNDVFGTSFHWPVQSYGFFLALAFLAGGYVVWLELGRKEREGLLSARVVLPETKVSGWADKLVTFLSGFILGFKLFLLFDNYELFASDPQAGILSLDGNLWWGLTGGGLLLALNLYFERHFSPASTKEEFFRPRQHTPVIILIAAVTGIIGAKIFHLLENPDEFTSDPVASLLSFDGLTFYGGLIVAAIAVAWYGNRNGIHWRLLGDAVAPALILAYGIGRMGCHVAGDGDWGIVNTLARPDWLFFIPEWLWAYDYPNNILGEGVPIPGCTGPYCFRLEQAVFPTPLYETMLCLIIFGVLWKLRKKLSIPGMLFAVYLIANGIERFAIEQIRINNTFDFFGLTITQAQLISVSLIIAGLFLAWWFKRNPVINQIKHA
jgi:phosphatidylglycerol---prolipoprotein diacylglyceryl transferase